MSDPIEDLLAPHQAELKRSQRLLLANIPRKGGIVTRAHLAALIKEGFIAGLAAAAIAARKGAGK